MNKYKVLIGKHYELLSVTETENLMPEGADRYYDMATDMRLPDFLLVRANTIEEARQMGLDFIDEWKRKHEAGEGGLV